MNARIYLDAVQQFAHTPEAVSLNVPQGLFLETGHVKVLHLLLWRRQKSGEREREMVRNEHSIDRGAGERKLEVKGIGRRQRDLLSTDAAGSSIMNRASGLGNKVRDGERRQF